MIGDTVELICIVVVSNIGSNVNVNIQWINTANDVIKETTLSTSSYTINETYSLTIESVSISDAGQYVCRASTTSNTSLLIHGDAVYGNININVMCKLLYNVIANNHYSLTNAVPPPTVMVTPEDGRLRDNITLTCTVSADNVDEHAMAVVEWRKNEIMVDVATISVGDTNNLWYKII